MKRKNAKQSDKQNVKQPDGFLLKYILKNRWKFAGGIFFLSAGALLSLAIPEILRRFIDASMLREKDAAYGYLGDLVLVSLGIYVLKGVFYYLRERLISGAAYKTGMEIRCDIFKTMEFLPFSHYKDKKAGEIVSGITNNVSAIEDFLLNSLPGFFSQPVIIAGIFVLIFLTNWKLALLSLLVFPFMFSAMAFFGGKSREYSKKLQTGVMGIVSFLFENFSNMRIVKLYCREEDESKRFGKISKTNMDTAMSGIRIAAVMTPIIEMVSCIGLVAFFWYGGIEIIRGRMTAGELVKFVTCITMLVPYLKSIGADYTRYQKMKGALDGISEYLRYPGHENTKGGSYELSGVKRGISFKNVYFKYDDSQEWILKNINVDIKAGEKIAVIGKNGAGKTTLVNLIPRLFDPQEGLITIDGHDIRDVSVESLRSCISVIPQELMLFNETVYFNVAFGKKDATQSEIEAAARLAHIDEFVSRFPQGFNTVIGERGEHLSAGQRQRLAIARAIISDPSILIMDEATSALDAESEQLVREALDHFGMGRNLFVIAHRLSSVVNADRIMVLDRGCLVECGTHQELLDLGGHYSQLYGRFARTVQLKVTAS